MIHINVRIWKFYLITLKTGKIFIKTLQEFITMGKFYHDIFGYISYLHSDTPEWCYNFLTCVLCSWNFKLEEINNIISKYSTEKMQSIKNIAYVFYAIPLEFFAPPPLLAQVKYLAHLVWLSNLAESGIVQDDNLKGHIHCAHKIYQTETKNKWECFIYVTT